MDISDQNDGESSRVFSGQHPEVVHWDDGEARIIEDASDGDGVANACKGGSFLDPRSWRVLPHGGANCHGFINRSTIGVGVWRFGEGGEHGRAIRDGGSTSLPSFRSRNSGKTLRAAIIHYMVTSARLQ
jgi:hypothetical protein